MSIAPG